MNTVLDMLFKAAKTNTVLLSLLLTLLTVLMVVTPVLASSGATGNSG
jgi:hypothetical protein